MERAQPLSAHDFSLFSCFFFLLPFFLSPPFSLRPPFSSLHAHSATQRLSLCMFCSYVFFHTALLFQILECTLPDFPDSAECLLSLVPEGNGRYIAMHFRRGLVILKLHYHRGARGEFGGGADAVLCKYVEKSHHVRLIGRSYDAITCIYCIVRDFQGPKFSRMAQFFCLTLLFSSIRIIEF